MHWGRQCAAPIELPDAGLGNAPKGELLGLGGGVNAFFCVVSCWQSVKIRKCLLKNAWFSMHREQKCLAPTELPHDGPSDVPKGASLGLVGGVNAFFCGVSCWQGVKNPRRFA